MSRFKRIDAPGESFHIISRFVDREYRIPSDPVRDVYLGHLERALEATDWRIPAYAAMSSHVHLLGTQGEDELASLLRSAHGGFARYANERENRLGPVFSARASSILLRGDAFREALAYIHNNPVRAGLVSNPAESTWTSHRAYVGLAPRPPWLDVEHGLARAGFDDSAAGRRAFHEFVVMRSREPRDRQRSAVDCERFRARVRVAMNRPVELESPRIEDDAVQYGVWVAEGPRSFVRRPRWSGSIAAIGPFADRVLGVDRSTDDVRDRSRAHTLALRVGCVELGRPIAEVAGVLQIPVSTATKLLRAERRRSRFASQAAMMSAALRSRTG